MLTKITAEVETISALPDRPNQTLGLTSAQMKANYDLAGKIIKAFVNDTLIPELESTADSSSGADQIGTTAIKTGGAVTVQGALEDLKGEINGAVLGQIPDDSLTNAKLGTDIKVGSLATLTTTEKSSVVGAVNELGALVSTKAAKSSEVSKTLSAASWTGTASPYSYSLTVDGVTATSNQEMLPTVDITEAQLTALQGANIQDGGQAADTITLKAWGDKPTIDLSIRVILRGDA